ncbi:MAG: VIT1/CCC1 transporter family protein [Anaerolineales bacterium]
MQTEPGKLQEFREYRRIAGVDQIGRRYFAMNAFDGILTMIGVLMGSLIARISDPFIVLYTGLTTSLAMGVSGFWGAYVTESAERKHELAELEHAMLRSLSHSKQARAGRFAVIVVSIIDGVSPLLAGFIVLIPFLLPTAQLSIRTTYLASLGIAMVLLFGLGVYLANIAKEGLIRSGLRMLFAGVLCVGLSVLLSTFGG